MNYPSLFIIGFALLGILIPEFIAQATRNRAPIGQNLISSIACALIAAAFVL